MKSESIAFVDPLEQSIHTIRGQRVMLDHDLAKLYGVPTKALNQAVDRNISRFPEDFSFYLNKEEWEFLKSQFVTSKKQEKNLKSQIATSNENQVLKFQFGTSKKGSGGKQKLPRVFTEHGAYAAAFILRSSQAQIMSVEVVRAFVRMRKFLASHEELIKHAKEIQSFVLKHSHKTDQEFHKVWKAIEKLSKPPDNIRRIGFALD